VSDARIVVDGGAGFQLSYPVRKTLEEFHCAGLHPNLQWWARAQVTLESGEKLQTARRPVDLAFLHEFELDR